MVRYIDKDALVAEIERRIKSVNSCPFRTAELGSEKFNEGQLSAYNVMLSFLNTIEVKDVDLEKDVRQIIYLYYEGIKYYEDIIKEEREENGGSNLAIKIMDGVVDARELGIQYVIDKLKAQKGEEV